MSLLLILVKSEIIFPEESQHKTKLYFLHLVHNHLYDCKTSTWSFQELRFCV